MGWMSSVQVHGEAVCLSGLGLEAESYERSGSSATSVPPVLRRCPTTIGLGLDCPMPCFLAFATLRESSTWINSPSLDFHRSLRPDPLSFFLSSCLFFRRLPRCPFDSKLQFCQTLVSYLSHRAVAHVTEHLIQQQYQEPTDLPVNLPNSLILDAMKASLWHVVLGSQLSVLFPFHFIRFSGIPLYPLREETKKTE